MQRSILIVDEDDARRRSVASSLAARGVRYLDVGDAFAGMAALGRADFGCVLGFEGRRTLSLRGLCQLARKRHPDILVFVVPKPESDEEDIRRVLEMPFDILHMKASTERFVTELVARFEEAADPTRPGVIPDSNNDLTPPHEFNPFDMPSTQDASGVFDSVPRVDVPRLDAATTPFEVPSAVPASAPPPGLDFEDELPPAEREVTRPDARRPQQSSASSEAAAITVDGNFDDLEGGAGAAFLMSLFSQELTGRLVVDSGDAAGAVYLYQGEPVWADDPHGDAGLYRKLVQKSFLRPDQAVQPVAEGQLLGSLLASGGLNSTQMHDFMREIVRDRVLAFAMQTAGSWRFTEDRAFLDTAPLLKVNPFGLVLESRRRALSPPALMALQSEIEDRFAVPGPGIAAADEKLTPFLRGAKASAVFDGQRTVKDTLASVGLDPFMGTLVLVALRDARLVVLEDAPRAATMDLAERAIDAAVVESDEELRAREDIYALYLRLKPLSQPRQVLGVGVDADEGSVDAAYQQRMVELDPSVIPEGSAKHILMQRVDELRRKVTSAYQTLKLQIGTSSVDDQNPF
jgi:hypothetical protein